MAVTAASLQKRVEALEADNQKLKDELTQFKRSPYFLSYTTILHQVNNFCEQVKTPIDINDPESKEAFNMRWKFTQELPTLLVNLDGLREKMTPAEQRQADKLREDSMVESFATNYKRHGG
jgi:hypothetical protein